MAIREYINGKEVTKEESDKYFAKRTRETAKALKTESGRKGLANALRRDTQAWESHESISRGVPPNQAKEFAETVRKAGLAGVEVQPNGSVIFKGPGNQAAFDKAFNLADNSSAGSGSTAEVGKAANKQKREKNVTRADLRRIYGPKYDELISRVKARPRRKTK